MQKMQEHFSALRRLQVSIQSPSLLPKLRFVEPLT